MKKQICMVAYTQYPYDARIRREAETLATHPEYDVSVLVPKEGKLPRRYAMEGVKIIELNLRRYQGRNRLAYLQSYILFTLAAFLQCTRSWVRRRCDIIHIHNMPNFLVFAALIPRFAGKKILLDIHDSVPETYAAKFGKKSNLLFKLLCSEESICCRFAHRIICVNHVQRDTLIRRGIPRHKIDVSLNVPDPKWFGRHSDNGDGKRDFPYFNLVYHGTLAERLGIDLAIQAIPKLVQKIPNIRFHIIGGGDDAEAFVALSRKLGVDPYVHFENFVPLESLVTILDGMHLGIVANRRNAATELMLPVKMLEYVALDIPVVAPRLKTIQYYFSEEMVSYFEPEDIDSLAGVILGIYQDDLKRRTQVQTAKRFIEKYGWESHQWDLINLYKDVG